MYSFFVKRKRRYCYLFTAQCTVCIHIGCVISVDIVVSFLWYLFSFWKRVTKYNCDNLLIIVCVRFTKQEKFTVYFACFVEPLETICKTTKINASVWLSRTLWTTSLGSVNFLIVLFYFIITVSSKTVRTLKLLKINWNATWFNGSLV